jgi:hypothetical protein
MNKPLLVAEPLAEAVPATRRALARAEQGLGGDPAAMALLQRVSQLVAQKLALPGGPLQQASHDPATLALDDLSLLSELVIQALQREKQPLQREHLLRLRGEQALAQLLEQHGGCLRPLDVANLLSLKDDSIRRRRERKRLLAVPRGKHTLYPVFQFDLENRRVWPALESLLPLLDTDSGAAQLRFLLSPDAELGGNYPAELLCRQEPTSVEVITHKAQQFGRHMAR